jgi:hypothetical protein
MSRRPDQDEAFIAAVADEFPHVATRQLLPTEAPPGAPHLVLSSTSSQLALSALQADFEVRFYGDFPNDPGRCHEYIRQKMQALLRGWNAIGQQPSFVGLIITIHFSFGQDPEHEALRHVMQHHFQPEVDSEILNDAKTQVTLRLADHYFALLAVGVYELKMLNRPVMAGAAPLVVAPWEGDVTDRGVELTVDVNDRLRAIIEREHPVVDSDELAGTLALSERLTTGPVGARFAEAGDLDLPAVLEETT